MRIIPPAMRDANRAFRHLGIVAKVAAIDQTRNLALFPDRHPCVDGDLLDLKYQKIRDQIFYRLRVDDGLFKGKSLRVFFYPQNKEKTIWVIGVDWRNEDTYSSHMMARLNKRVKEIVNQKS